MEGDPEIEELKELVRRNTLLVQDTNKVVRSMRRSQRLHTFLSIAWWLVVLGVSAYAYYTYVMPYVEQIMSLYDSAQGFDDQIRGVWGQYFGTTTRP